MPGVNLFHLPDVVGLKEFGKVVVLLCSLHLLYLSSDTVVVCRSIDIADDTESYWETVAIAHEGELELQGVVFAVSIVHEDVSLCDAVLAYLDNLQAKAFLHETILAVFTEDERFAVLNVDGVLRASLLRIDVVVSAIVEDDTVLENLTHGSTLVVVGSLEDVDSARRVSRHGTSEEVAASSEAELSRAEGVFYSAVR